jgi:hypothetical protein
VEQGEIPAVAGLGEIAVAPAAQAAVEVAAAPDEIQDEAAEPDAWQGAPAA